MLVEGAIYPMHDAAGFTREAWSQLVSSRREFRRYPAREIRNPFDGQAASVFTPSDAAEVVIDGRSVGKVYWSMSEEPLINVSVEPVAMPLIQEWAAAIGGRFKPGLQGS